MGRGLVFLAEPGSGRSFRERHEIGGESPIMQPVKGKWIAIAIAAFIGIAVALAAYELFFKRS